MPATDRTAAPDAAKRTAGRGRRAARGFEVPVVREIAPVAHGGEGDDVGRRHANHALDGS
jgi:hypothetical protein